MALALDAVLPRPVLVATLAVALLSLLIDLAPSELELEPVDFGFSLRTAEQQARYESRAAALLRSDSGAGVFSRFAEVLLEGEALAPEDLAVSADGVAFTGLGDGRIVSLTPDPKSPDKPLVLRNWTRTGRDLAGCGSPELEPACGRPLGLQFAPGAPFAAFLKRIPSARLFAGDQVLLVADAHKGLLLVDAAGRKTLLFSHVKDPATGERERVRLLNGVAVPRDGRAVFVTESSRRFARDQVVLEFLERKPTGRLLRLDLDTGRVSVAADGLAFPNGLAMLADAERGGREDVVMALSTAHKLVKYSLETRRVEDFAFLPSEPDNVAVAVVNGKPAVLVGLAAPSTGVVGLLKTRVKTRKVLSLLPLWVSLLFVQRSGSFAVLDAASGDIQRVYEDTTGRAFLVSGVKRFGDYFYLLSWSRHALARIPAAVLEEA